jgi:hypothetical protein
MAQFSAGNSNFTVVAHATNANNWGLQTATVGHTAKIKMINWGGSSLTSTGYRTRWGRWATTTPVTPTVLAATSNNNSVSNVATCSTFATPGALAAEPSGLYQQNWNSLGGGGGIVLPIGGEWIISGGALGTAYSQILCGNTAGAEANLSNYGVSWEE